MGGDRLPPMDVDYRSEIEAFPTWVVDIEGEIAGGLIMAFEGDHASIANVAVHPTFQGRGVGGGLMRFAESEAKTRGYSDLRLATHVLLTENVALYLHLGWTEIERDGVRVFMKKTLEI